MLSVILSNFAQEQPHDPRGQARLHPRAPSRAGEKDSGTHQVGVTIWNGFRLCKDIRAISLQVHPWHFKRDSSHKGDKAAHRTRGKIDIKQY